MSMSKIIRLIGDVHGKWTPYKKIIKDSPPSIQVGDMGVGFMRTQGPNAGEEYSNPPHAKMLAGGHRFIRGNHDNPAACKRHSQYIPDGTIEDGVMFIGGAVSIDKQFRIPGYSWWEDEELSQEELERLIDVYAKTKPRVMVTHDCPESIANMILIHLVLPSLNGSKMDFPSRSRQAFERMLAIHKPELWIFGHWHINVDYLHDGTRFVCLAELSYQDFRI